MKSNPMDRLTHDYSSDQILINICCTRYQHQSLAPLVQYGHCWPGQA